VTAMLEELESAWREIGSTPRQEHASDPDHVHQREEAVKIGGVY
jgi:hypothetical protein